MSDMIARMLANRRLGRVVVNRDYAATVIEIAKQYVRTAEALGVAPTRLSWLIAEEGGSDGIYHRAWSR